MVDFLTIAFVVVLLGLTLLAIRMWYSTKGSAVSEAERRLYGRECEGYFIDIGLPESLEEARRELIALAHRPATAAR